MSLMINVHKCSLALVTVHNVRNLTVIQRTQMFIVQNIAKGQEPPAPSIFSVHGVSLVTRVQRSLFALIFFVAQA